MSYPYRIRLKKEQKPDILDQHPNLTAPVNYTLKTIVVPTPLEGMAEEEVKSFIESRLASGMRVPDRELKETEEVDIVLDEKNPYEEGRAPVWQGEVEMPEKCLEPEGQTEQQTD